MPSTLHRPILVLNPTFPVILAGIRTDPAVSVPKAMSAESTAKLTPAPLDDPPGTRCSSRSQGFRGVVQCGFTPKPPKANSTAWVLPVTTANWRLRVFITGPSLSQRLGKGLGLPAKVGKPFTP